MFPSIAPLFQINSSFVRSRYTRFNRKWFFDAVYSTFVAAPTLRAAYHHTYQGRDRGLLEFLGPHGFSTEVYGRSRLFTSITLGLLGRPLLLLLIGLVVALFSVTGWSFVLPILDTSLAFVLVRTFIVLFS